MSKTELCACGHGRDVHVEAGQGGLFGQGPGCGGAGCSCSRWKAMPQEWAARQHGLKGEEWAEVIGCSSPDEVAETFAEQLYDDDPDDGGDVEVEVRDPDGDVTVWDVEASWSRPDFYATQHKAKGGRS